VRERIEYRFRVPSAAVFTLYSYSKGLEYRFRVPTAGSLRFQSLPRLVLNSSPNSTMQKRDSPSHQNVGKMHGVINVDEIKN
jgi:hypothetical protein